MKSLKVGLLVAAGAAAVLIPLYGDPRQAPVTHPEWARMMLRGLELETVLVSGASASLAFDSLSWRTSQSLTIDRPFRSVGVEIVAGPPKQVRAGAGAGEVGYRFAAPRTGDYRIRVRLVGGGAATVGVDVTADGSANPARAFAVEGRDVVEAGVVYLTPGLYTLAVSLPPGAALEWVEVVPPCVNSIEPRGGWQPTAIATTTDVALTVLKALDLESELPPAATPIEVPGVALQPTTTRILKASLRSDVEGFWLQADANGVQAVAHVDIPEPGLYTLYGFGLKGGGQSWLIDACHKSVLCPSTQTPETPAWHPLMTAEFSAGSHSFTTTLANGAAIQRLRLERKKDQPEDYIGTLARLGLDLGEPRPIPRALARDAERFLEARRRSAISHCSDVVLPASSALVAGLAVPGGSTLGPTNPAQPPGAGPGPGGGPFAPLPGPSGSPVTPSPSPSPTTGPSPSPSPVTPSPSPAPSPSPSLGPPPTTQPQPPASPIK